LIFGCVLPSLPIFKPFLSRAIVLLSVIVLMLRCVTIAALCLIASVTVQNLAEPIWRHLLRLHLDHSDPAVTQHAVAALAE
jgi:hypothetical protein